MEPIAPTNRVSARRYLGATLDDALRREDYALAAELNAILGRESAQHAYRALMAWEGLRSPETGLIPWVA